MLISNLPSLPGQQNKLVMGELVKIEGIGWIINKLNCDWLIIDNLDWDRLIKDDLDRGWLNH